MKNNKKLQVTSLMLKANYRLIGLFAFCLLLFACSCEKKVEKKAAETQKVQTPAFNEDSAYSYVAKQVSFGPRVPNTINHDQCGEYLVSFLKSTGFTVKVQEFQSTAFDGNNLRLKNIIASYKPEASYRILLAAHWDTRPFADQDTVNKNKPIAGANDGGSGVGVLMEIARVIQVSKLKPEVGIDIILFDGEDYGETQDYKGPMKDTYCLGSQYWAKNKGSYSAFFGILLDMVGAKNAKFGKEGNSMQYAPTVVNTVWTTGKNLGYGDTFLDIRTSPITDDHYYINTLASIPTIDIIEFDPENENYFGDYWHTHNDNMNVIDKKTLKIVGQTLLEVIYNDYKSLI